MRMQVNVHSCFFAALLSRQFTSPPSPRKLSDMRLARILPGLFLFLRVNPIDEAFLLDLADNRIIDHIINGDFDCRIRLACVRDENFHARGRALGKRSKVPMVVVLVVFKLALVSCRKLLPMIFLARSLLALKKCVASMSDITTFFTFSRFLAI